MYDSNVLTHATSSSLWEDGEIDASKLVKEATSTTPTRATKILKKWKDSNQVQMQLTENEALALIISCNLNIQTYKILRKVALNHGHDLFPSYQKVLEAKKLCYPSDIQINEVKCEVPLQSLLNHTAEKIMKLVPLNEKINEVDNYELICKWGFDGSGSHSTYKQVFQDEQAGNDENIVCTSFVPLRLRNKNTNIDVWQNKKPSSSRFCRPIALQWTKENKDVMISEEKRILEQIINLNTYRINSYNIEYKLLMTMVDGKVFIGVY